MVAKKDFEIQHDDIATKNLYVVKAMQSLTSRGYVKTQFAWQHYYYTLTDEGIEYLKEFLGLPEGVAPKTLLEAPIPTRQVARKPQGARREGGNYRRREARD